MENIRLISEMESKCTGCGACENLCPRGAISMKERDGGFVFPVVEEGKCIHCGLCLKRCPLNNLVHEYVPHEFPIAYGGYAKDVMALSDSTSGGVFTILARYIFARGGVVCGAAFTSGCNLEHVIISKEEELSPLKGSKYLQSYTGDIYSRVKKLLDGGTYVLFTGTPCQVAALKAVLGRAYENLLTADIFCHGVPPASLFKKYVDSITGGKSATAYNIRFRETRPSDEMVADSPRWRSQYISFDYDGGRYSRLIVDDEYEKGFRENLYIRKSCGNCQFSWLPRQGDFTLGDFLASVKEHLGMEHDTGVSTIVVNNKKAFDILVSLRNEFALLKEVSIKTVSATNLLQAHSYRHPHMERFMKVFKDSIGDDSVDMQALITEWLDKCDGVAIVNFHDSKNNYGSVLTAYALQEKIRQIIGFSPVNVAFGTGEGGHPDISDLRAFTKEYIYETYPCRTQEKLMSLNKYFSTFIAGPDGVWRNMGFIENFYSYLLDFAQDGKNICSYAPSYGLDRIVNTKVGDPTPREPTEADLAERKRLLKRFAHVSVREDSGVRITKEIFGVDAQHVLDAVFLLTAEDYQKLIDKATVKIPQEEYFVKYIINQSCVDSALIDYIDTQNPIPLYEGADHIQFIKKQDISQWKYRGPKMCDWLKLVKHCKYMVTDSFHGLCFAIIFRKPFILTNVTFAGSERHMSLLRMFGIEDGWKYVACTPSDYMRILQEGIDYNVLEPKIEQWISSSEAFLREVLADNQKGGEDGSCTL